MAVPEIWGELTQSVEGGEGLVVEMPIKNTKLFFINPRWLVGDGISEPNQQYMFFFSFLMSHGRMNWKCTMVRVGFFIVKV